MSDARPHSTRIGVAHVVLGLQVGGLERVVVNLARGLQSTRYRPMIVCLEQGGPFAALAGEAGVPVHVLGKREGMDWDAIRRLAAWLREQGVRIVHTHNPVPHFHGVMAAIRAPISVRVHTKHGRNYPNDRKKVLLNRALSWFTHALVPVSDNARDVLREVEHVHPAKIRRIWNGVDTDLYRPASPVEQRPPVIGTVARLSPEKDQVTMLAAFKLVLESIPETRLVFAGDGSCAAELRDRAAKLGVAERVDFLGMRTDIPAVLETFCLFTLSSVSEGLSMTTLEAMAAGLPVVATDAGGNRELVQPPRCGLIVPQRDAKALAEAYLRLLRQPPLRAEMGRAARGRIERDFSIKKMVSDYVHLYDELLDAPRGRA